MADSTGRKIDMGRLIVVPLFSVLIFFNMLGIQAELKVLQPATMIKIAKLLHLSLIACFNILVVFLYIVRTSSKSTSRSLLARVVAVIGAFLPISLPFLAGTTSNVNLLLAADGVTISGMTISIYSLSVLGRSFSIIPEARTLVQTGPYGFVRHPLYLGELIAMLGIVMSRPSILTAVVLCIMTTVQIYRAAQEEKLLAKIFPEYESYSFRTARFLPGLF